MKKEFKECLNNINNFRKITDMRILYLMAYKKLYLFDMISKKVIKEFTQFRVDDFNNLMSELDNIDLWNSDYMLEIKIETF